jgi:hypothetical protein
MRYANLAAYLVDKLLELFFENIVASATRATSFTLQTVQLSG